MIGGLELHPAVVHFPIALTVIGALAGISFVFLRRDWLRWFAPVLLSLALLGGVAAYFSGESAKDRAEAAGVPNAALEQHEETGIIAIGLVALACFLSWATHVKRRGEWIAAIVGLIAAGLILWNGHLGGRLVFLHGAGRVHAPVGERRAP